MAVIKAVNSRASLARAVNYITGGEKTERTLVGGYNCNPMCAIEEMRDTNTHGARRVAGSTNTSSKASPTMKILPRRKLLTSQGN